MSGRTGIDGAARAGLVGPLRAPPRHAISSLVDFAPPYSVPKLVQLAGASSGVAYRVVEFLEREDILRKEPRKGIVDVDWRQLIERERRIRLRAVAVRDRLPRAAWSRDDSRQVARLRPEIRTHIVERSAVLRAVRTGTRAERYATSIDEGAAARPPCRTNRRKCPVGRPRGRRRIRACEDLRSARGRCAESSFR